MPKNILKPFFAVFLSLLLILSACSNNSINNLNTANQSDLVQTNNISRKNLKIKTNSNLKGYKVFAPLQEATVKNNTATVQVNTQIPQLITLTDQNNVPLAYALVTNPALTATVNIDFESTAAALIFMTPSIATTDLKEADRILKDINNLSETKALARMLQNNNGLEQAPPAGFDNIFATAIEKTLNTTARYSPATNSTDNSPTRVEGVDINVKKTNGDKVVLQISNHKKRTVDLYFQGEMNSSIQKHLHYESIPSALKFFNGFKTGFRPFVKDASVDVNSKLTEVEVLGLGIKDIKEFRQAWNKMSKEEKYKYGFPIAKTFIFDFISPIISITVGFNINKTFEAGLNQIVSELPMYDIITEFAAEKYSTVFKLLVKSTVNSLIKDKAKLLRKLLLSGGLSFSDSIIKRINTISGIWTIAKSSIEFVRALNSYRTTNIKGIFEVRYTGDKIQFIRSNKPIQY